MISALLNNRNYIRKNSKLFRIQLSIHEFLHNWKSRIRTSDPSGRCQNKHNKTRIRKSRHKNRNKTCCRKYNLYSDNKKNRIQSFRRKNHDNSVMFRTDKHRNNICNRYNRRYRYRTSRGKNHRSLCSSSDNLSTEKQYSIYHKNYPTDSGLMLHKAVPENRS